MKEIGNYQEIYLNYHSQRSSATGHCSLGPACNKPVNAKFIVGLFLSKVIV